MYANGLSRTTDATLNRSDLKYSQRIQIAFNESD